MGDATFQGIKVAVSAFEILINVHGHYFLCGTVRALHAKCELFFHFPWGSRTPGLITNVSSATTQRGYLPDHISFHRDGQIHATTRDVHKKVNHENALSLGSSPFNLPRGKFLPIYLESISLTNEAVRDARLRRIAPTDEQRSRAWDLSDVQHFSFLLISKCSRVHPERLLSSHGFEMLNIIGRPAILIGAFTAREKSFPSSGSRSDFGTDLLILVVRQSWMERPQKGVLSPETDYSLASASVCMPPIDRFKDMQDLNNAH